MISTTRVFYARVRGTFAWGAGAGSSAPLPTTR